MKQRWLLRTCASSSSRRGGGVVGTQSITSGLGDMGGGVVAIAVGIVFGIVFDDMVDVFVSCRGQTTRICRNVPSHVRSKA